MLKPTVQRILTTARQLWRQPITLACFAALYALLLATLYGFAVVREATLGQVLLTTLLMLAASLVFLMLQAAIIDHAQNRPLNWRRLLRNALRLATVTVPVIIIGAALFLILIQWESAFPAPAASRQTLHWPTLLFSTLRWLLFGIALPLATIHLWIFSSEISNFKSQDPTDARRHKPLILRRARMVLSRAFTPGSVFTYTVGLVLFGLVPYAILFVQLPLKGARTDFAILIARLVLVFVATLFGWVLTITALAHEVLEFEGQIIDDGEPVGSFELHSRRRSQFV